jgi:elongation factor G
MKIYQTNEIKNLAIIGNAGSGKTTLAEAMLFEGGLVKRKGNINAHSTVCDYFPIEHEYGYSVYSTVFHVEWKGKKLNLVDCPGSDDFVGGAVTALNVADAALLILNTQYGIEVGTQNSFRLADKYHKPVIFVLNQLDHEKAEFDRALDQLKEAFGSKVMPVQFPVESGPGFNAIVDVLEQKLYTWKAEGTEPQVEEIPANLKAKAEAYYAALIEAAAENDEALMEKFFEEGSLNNEETAQRNTIRPGSKGNFPCCLCLWCQRQGVSHLLDFLQTTARVKDVPTPKNSEGEKSLPTPLPPAVYISSKHRLNLTSVKSAISK